MKHKPIRNARPLVRRNGRCPFCTSGKKFKHCHGAPQVNPDTVGENATPVCFAGHMQEKPGFGFFHDVNALGPIPTVRG